MKGIRSACPRGGDCYLDSFAATVLTSESVSCRPTPGNVFSPGHPWSAEEGHFPISAYSEFMPPPCLGPKPYGTRHRPDAVDGDPFGWAVTEYEEAFELRPGLDDAGPVAPSGALAHLGDGDPVTPIGQAASSLDNPYWPEELAEGGRQAAARALRRPDAAGPVAHPGRQGPRPLDAVRRQRARARPRVLEELLHTPNAAGPTRRKGIDFLPPAAAAYGATRSHDAGPPAGVPHPAEGETSGGRDGGAVADVDGAAASANRGNPARREVPAHLPPVRQAARAGASARPTSPASCTCCPSPAACCSGGAGYRIADAAARIAVRAADPALAPVRRHEDPHGIRVPQSGWMHEPRPGQADPTRHHGPLRNTFKRTHRWERIHRDEDELAVIEREDKMAHVLFSTEARRPRPVRQADGPQRPALDRRRPPAARRPRRRPPSRSPTPPRVLCEGGHVRLPLPLPRDARRPARGLLAPPAGRLPVAASRSSRPCSPRRRSAT